jgi:hypothetical protein
MRVFREILLAIGPYAMATLALFILNNLVGEVRKIRLALEARESWRTER